MFLFGHMLVAKVLIPSFWIWLYWINPIQRADCLVQDILADGVGSAYVEKRIVFAMEMAGNPSVIFFDAPFLRMDTLRSPSSQHAQAVWGRAMVVVSNAVTAFHLNAFHSLLMLGSGGEMVFFGPAGRNGHALV
ncbi:hypothetical protein CLOP_g15784, partial [Closterium sp. NIES-67]